MDIIDFKALGLKEPSKIAKMNTGSCSINYYIKNEDGEFLIKLIQGSSKTSKDRLLSNLNHTRSAAYCPHLLFEKRYGDYSALVFQWIDGQNYFLEKLPLNTFRHIISAYLAFSQTLNASKMKGVLPAINPLDVIAEIPNFPFFIRGTLRAIQADLSYHPEIKVIHGDFHFKNIVFKNNELQSFLDFENFRYGSPTEDLMRLIITNAEQHNFFRKSYTLKLLTVLLEMCPYSRQAWLYGLDLCILGKYQKKLRTPRLGGLIALFRCNCLYSKLRQRIHAYFDSH